LTEVNIGAVEWRFQFRPPLPRPPVTDDPKARAYWRGIELVPNLGILLTQLAPSLDQGADPFKKAKLALEQLPYSLGGMSYAFFEFVRHQAELKTLAPERGVIVPQPGKTEPLSFMLDMFLDHARRTANAVIPYLRYKYSLHHGELNKSMAQTMERKLLAKAPRMPRDVCKLIEEYWEHHGETAKAYRDLAQHYTLLVYDDCMLSVSQEGTPAMYVALPNNPEEDRATPSYDPPIHAAPYMRELLHESIRFVHWLSVRLLDTSKPLNVATSGPNIRGWMGPSRQVVRVASVDMIDAELRKLTVELAEEETHGAG
jgi:hypothetical protein